jgi:Rieske Fe-S protein
MRGSRPLLSRRAFLSISAALSSFFGVGRRLRAQAGQLLRYRPLARPSVIPTDDLATLWRARPFTAEGVSLPSAATPNQAVRVAGMVVRTGPGQFSAVCLRCPHELCDVDYVSDPGQIPQEVIDAVGHPMKDPVYICPCHNSTFKVEDGERLAGPAPRGLYRFRVTSVGASAIEIGEVEEDVLIFV